MSLPNDYSFRQAQWLSANKNINNKQIFPDMKTNRTNSLTENYEAPRASSVELVNEGFLLDSSIRETATDSYGAAAGFDGEGAKGDGMPGFGDGGKGDSFGF